MNLEMECSVPYVIVNFFLAGSCKEENLVFILLENLYEKMNKSHRVIYLCNFIFQNFHHHIYRNLTTLLQNLFVASFLHCTLPNHR